MKLLLIVHFTFLTTLLLSLPSFADENKDWLKELRTHTREGTCPNSSKWKAKYKCRQNAECGNLKLCEEAYFHLIVCGAQFRDGGSYISGKLSKEEFTKRNWKEPDGVPCEVQHCSQIDDDKKLNLASTMNRCYGGE